MIVLDKLQNTENLSPNEITVANYLIQVMVLLPLPEPMLCRISHL